MRESDGIKHELSRGYWLYQHIQAKKQQIARLNAMAACPPPPRFNEPRIKSRTSRTESIALRIQKAEGQLSKMVADYLSVSDRTQKEIDRLPSDRMRLILELRYINLLKWEPLAKQVHYSVRQAQRIHDRAIDALAGKPTSKKL